MHILGFTRDRWHDEWTAIEKDPEGGDLLSPERVTRGSFVVSAIRLQEICENVRVECDAPV
jgi:hypothetical protein